MNLEMQIDDDGTVLKFPLEWSLPTLYKMSKTGKVTQWSVGVMGKEDSAAEIIIVHGYTDGLKQTTAREVNKGKNAGKANETTPWEQAKKEATSLWQKKVDAGMTEKIPSKVTVKRPMLAHKYTEKTAKNINIPFYVQPKLDGIRCLATRRGDEIIYESRGGKEFKTLEHLTPALLTILKEGETIDGELYTTNLDFQKIISGVKRDKPNEYTPLIDYWVYDWCDTELDYDDRVGVLETRLDQNPFGGIIGTPSYILESLDDIQDMHDEFIERGFEGLMIRNVTGGYEYNYRSKNLLKYKNFIDEEFPIIGGEEGQGKAKGQVTFICETPTGQSFSVRPRGTDQQREEWWKNLDNIVESGAQLTVRYQELSNDGVPRFPVGIAIRDYE